LIAILIFSLGILAIVGLQSAAIKNVSESQYRVEASMFADTIIAQIRTGAADTLTRQTGFNGDGNGAGADGPAYLAWRARVVDSATGLPGVPADSPTVNVANDGTVTVRLDWRAQTDTTTRHYETTTLVD
jgi:type IV pilus assembly protein PilV